MADGDPTPIGLKVITKHPCSFKKNSDRDLAIKKALGEAIVDFCEHHGSEQFARYIYEYGLELARWVERVWRKETGHFKYGFSSTCGAGMHPFKPKYPWGWNKLKSLWEKREDLRPIGYRELTEGQTEKKRYYLVFASTKTFALVLSKTILKNSTELTPELIEKKKNDKKNPVDIPLDPDSFSDRMQWGAGRWHAIDTIKVLEYGKDAKPITPTLTNELPDSYDKLIAFLNS